MKIIRDNALRRTALAAASLLLLAASLPAQVAASPDRFSPLAKGYMERARTMLDAGNYAGVIDQLKHLDTDHSVLSALSDSQREEYVYMLAQALYNRGDRECVALLRDFEREFPASPLALKARLSIGDFYFFNHDWQKALDEYREADFDRLNRTDLALYTYRKALTLIKTEHYGEARPLVSRIAGIPEYKDAARYYTAYLDYIDGDLKRAYDGFSRVPADVPGLEPGFYMTQIEYTRGEYEDVIAHGRSLMKKIHSDELKPELNRIVGLSYFKEGEYDSARTFLLKYVDDTKDKPAPDAVYALGVTDYENGDYETAAERFSPLTGLSDDIAQSAWLYLGQCDVKTGNPDAAAMAFEKAARMDFDRDVSERALYNYVAAITRGGKIPFSSSVDLLEQFITTYPDSEYTPKVEEYLAVAYYNDRDYRKALARIEAIRNPSSSVLAAKQKILYELGVEAISNSRPEEAAGYLRRSIDLSRHNPEIAAQAWLWLGDAYYALEQWGDARQAYTRASQQIGSSANRTLALYDLAYSSYQLKDYAAAAREFGKALAASPALPASIRHDATIRRADCLYYSGDYASARSGYADAIADGAADADYATYRHAVMLGLGNDTKGKIRELSEMESRFPASRWLPTAMLEKAMTYESLGQTEQAVKSFRSVSEKYPDAVQARKALLNLALADSRAGRSDEAAEAYREIIERWPSSEEAVMAGDDLKKYYASNGRIGEYAEFLRNVPGARQLDAGEMEQLAFDGAEIAFADDISNILLLRNYVRDYPDGKYLAPALLDIAVSLEADGKYEEAEETLTRLIASRPHSAQYAEALLMKAQILENDLPGRDKDALLAYKELERSGGQEFAADAMAGVMRTTADPQERISYARKTRASGGLSADRAEEASLYEAKALMQTGQTHEAADILASLAGNPASAAGAEAAVTLARHHLEAGNYAEAERVALDFTDAGTPHSYWLAQGFIALADAYHAQGKTYLAKEYLESLRSNYPGKEKDILSAISSRLKSWK